MTYVLNAGFYKPPLLGRDVAALESLGDGRLELGDAGSVVPPPSCTRSAGRRPAGVSRCDVRKPARHRRHPARVSTATGAVSAISPSWLRSPTTWRRRSRTSVE